MTQPTGNPLAFRKPITLDSLDELFAHHRALTGGWSMTQSSPEPDPDGGNEPPSPPAYTPPATQADLDRIIGDRVARERAKYADYNDLKAKADAHDKALADAMTEQEKAVADARREGEQSALQSANSRLVAAEARALAAEAGFRIGAASVVRLLDLTDVGVNEAGEVDQAAIKAKLDDLKTAEPDLVGTAKTPPPKPDRSQGGGDTPPSGGGSVSAGRDLFAARRGKKSA